MSQSEMHAFQTLLLFCLLSTSPLLPCRTSHREGGITAPVSATAMRQDNLGLGAEAHGEVKEGDDAFEQYRKRMMLGYKHRPNPLGNPRKAYY